MKHSATGKCADAEADEEREASVVETFADARQYDDADNGGGGDCRDGDKTISPYCFEDECYLHLSLPHLPMTVASFLSCCWILRALLQHCSPYCSVLSNAVTCTSISLSEG